MDLIVSRGRRAVGVKVKLAPSVRDEDVRHLAWLKAEYGTDMVGGMVVTTGTTAYRRPDGFYVVPLALLGP